MTQDKPTIRPLVPGTQLARALSAIARPMLPIQDAAQQIKALIERDDTAAAVQALDPQTLFNLIKTAGFDQGVDLIPYATPDQIQAFFDFDTWRRDELLSVRMHRWVGALIEETSDAQFKQVVRELDSELLAIYFKRGLQVYLADNGRIPDDVPDEAVLSPDLQYAIIYPEDETHATNLRNLINRLFELDRVLAWTLIEAVRWELVSEMEEYAYRWRNARLQDHGFVPKEEAMAVYRLLDPVALREQLEQAQQRDQALPSTKPSLQTPAHQDLPTVLTSEFSDEFFILQILGVLEDPEQVRALLYELHGLVNRTLTADGIEPGELNSGRQVIRRTLGYLSLGLEYLSRADHERAQVIVQQLALKDILRAGYTIVVRLQHQARQLLHRPTLTMVDGQEYSLLNDHERALMEGLMRQRPTFAQSPEDFDLFKRQSQVDQAALRLGEIAIKQLWLFGAQRQSIEQLATLIYHDSLLVEPVDVTFDMCMTTVIAMLMARGQPALTPLTPADFSTLLEALAHAPWEADPAAYFNPILTEATRVLPTNSSPLLARWIMQRVEALKDELGALKDPQDALIVRTLVLLRKSTH